MDGAAERETESDAGSGPVARLVAVVLLILAVGGSVYEVTRRGIDPDELEHLHAAYLVSLGDVPYRDFFEHHAPAAYYVLAPAFWVFGPTLTVLWIGRGLAVVCGVGCLWVTGRMAERLGGRGTGLMAAAILAWSVVFHIKTLEFRPDVPAALLLLLAASRLWRTEASFRTAVVAGVLAGLATTFTQKSIVPAVGIWLGWLTLIGWRNASVRITAGYIAGGVAPWVVLFALFGAIGAADDLWHGAVVQLVTWPMRLAPWQHLRPVVAADLALWFLAFCEIVAVLVALARAAARREPRPPGVAVAVFVTFCVASLVLVKAAYPQYYLLWTPGLAVLAARRLTIWMRGEANLRFLVVTGGLALVTAIFLYGRVSPAMLNQPIAALPWLSPSLPRVSLSMEWGLVMLFGAVLFSAVHGYRARTVFFVVILGSFYGVLRNLDAHVWPNEGQVERIRAVNAAVPVGGRVFDGFTGFGALRRHAFYYWWLNPYSRALAGEAALEDALLETLQTDPPEAVLYDENIEALPYPVTEWIKKRYEPTEWDPLWLPKGNGRLTAVP